MQFRNFSIHMALFFLVFITNGISFGGEIDLSVKGGYFQYQEPDPSISYTGLMSGLQGSYKKEFPAFSLKVQSEFMSGRLSYKGKLNTHQLADGSAVNGTSSGTSLNYGSQLWYSDSAVFLGKSISRRDTVISPYIGLGFRYLNNSDNPDIPYDYQREQTYLYLPVMVEFQKSRSEKQSWGIIAELDVLLSGTAKADLSDASEKYNNLTFHQSMGAGLKLIGILNREIMGHSVSLKPFVEIWFVDDSDTDVLEYDGTRVLVRSADGSYDDYREPANITMTGGLQLNIRI